MKAKDPFDVRLRDRLHRIARLDLKLRTGILGTRMVADTMEVPFFDTPWQVSATGVFGTGGVEPTPAVGAVLCAYILGCPETPVAATGPVSFRDIPDAGPLSVNFANNTQGLICRTFSGRVRALEAAGGRLGGRRFPDSQGADLAMVFPALPRIPIHLRFFDIEEGLPAQCTLLFDGSARRFLSIQDLFVLGTYLAGNLIAPAVSRPPS
jgi:Domain of unknown function (DUF3786)